MMVLAPSQTPSDSSTRPRPRRSNLDLVLEALEVGLSLSVWDERGRERRFVRGQITAERSPKGGLFGEELVA